MITNRFFHLSSNDKVVAVPSAKIMVKRLARVFEDNMDTLLDVKHLKIPGYNVPKDFQTSSVGIDDDYRPVVVGYCSGDGTKVVPEIEKLVASLQEQTEKVKNAVAGTTGDNGKPMKPRLIEWDGLRRMFVATKFSTKSGVCTTASPQVELYEFSYYHDEWSNQFLLSKIPAGSDLLPGIPANAPDLPLPPTDGEGPVDELYIPPNDGSQRYPVLDNEHGERLRLILIYAGKKHGVEVKWHSSYIACNIGRTFLSVLPRNKCNKLYLRLDPNNFSKDLEQGSLRDARRFGHNGVGELELVVRHEGDMDLAMALIDMAYVNVKG